MDPLLKADAESFWCEAMANAGTREGYALAAYKGEIFRLMDKHFGPAYRELALSRRPGRPPE